MPDTVGIQEVTAHNMLGKGLNCDLNFSLKENPV